MTRDEPSAYASRRRIVHWPAANNVFDGPPVGHYTGYLHRMIVLIGRIMGAG